MYPQILHARLLLFSLSSPTFKFLMTQVTYLLFPYLLRRFLDLAPRHAQRPSNQRRGVVVSMFPQVYFRQIHQILRQ
jgi:hypothetical protein